MPSGLTARRVIFVSPADAKSPTSVQPPAPSRQIEIFVPVAIHVRPPEIDAWISRFEHDRREAALDFWYEMHKGTHESLREFQ